MASGVFGLKKVYKRQVENINNGNFASWTEDFSDAYIMAGQGPSGSPSNRSTILRINYINEVSAVLPSASNLPASNGLQNAATVSNHNYGYYGGGTNNDNNVISRLDFATELNSLPGTNLPTNVFRAGAISRVDYGYGYFIGGQNSELPVNPKQISTITRLDFSTETLSPMPNLPAATQSLRGFNGTTYGYAVGGDTSNPPVAVNTISRLDFSNNTLAVSLPGKNLTTPRTQFVANESPLYGYASAGASPTNISTIERLDFSTENTITLSALTPFDGTNYDGFSSLIGGYMMTNNAATTNRLNFSNETFQTGLAFDEARRGFGAVNARHKKYNQNTGTAAYVNRGIDGSEIDKFFYQTETWSGQIANANNKQALTGGAASNTYGYIFGGKKGTGSTSEISRIDFSNDTLTSGKKGGAEIDDSTLPSSVTSLQKAGVTQTNSYAYYMGGDEAASSSIFRMDFFTEIFDRRGSLPGTKSEFASLKSANTGYLIANNDSTVFRLNFSNETISTSLVYPLNLTGSPNGYAYNQLYGYFLGGKTASNTLSSVYRIDFSNDSFSLLTQYTPSGSDNGGGCSSGDSAAYLNILQTSGDSAFFRLEFSTEVLTQLSPSPVSRRDSVAITNTNT